MTKIAVHSINTCDRKVHMMMPMPKNGIRSRNGCFQSSDHTIAIDADHDRGRQCQPKLSEPRTRIAMAQLIQAEQMPHPPVVESIHELFETGVCGTRDGGERGRFAHAQSILSPRTADANRAPKRSTIGKYDILKSGCLEHVPYFLFGESFFQRCAKPIVGIRSHHVE